MIDKKAYLAKYLIKGIGKAAPHVGKAAWKAGSGTAKGVWRAGKAYGKGVSKLPTALQGTAVLAPAAAATTAYSLGPGMPRNTVKRVSRF